MRFSDLLGTRGDHRVGSGARPGPRSPRRAHTAHAEDHRARRRTAPACSNVFGIGAPESGAAHPDERRRSLVGRRSRRQQQDRRHGTTRGSGNRLRALPLYLTEAHIEKLLTPADALAAIEACFERQARGAIRNRPRTRTRAGEGALAVMSAVDEELGLAGLKSYVALPAGTPFVVVLFDLEQGRARGRDRGRPDGPAPHRRCERGRGEVPRQARSADARASSAAAGRRRARSRASARRCRAIERRGRLLPDREEPARVLRQGRRRTGREPPRPGPAGCRRHGHDLGRPRSARRVAPAGGARLRRRREPAEGARARQRRPRAGRPRLLRLDRAGEDRVGRPDRARRPRRPRLARGARAARGRRGRAPGPQLARTTSSSSSRTGSPPGTSRSAPSRSSWRRRRRSGSGSRSCPARTPDTTSSPSARINSGRSRSRSTSCGVHRLRTYGSSRISASVRPRSCSRMTYAATRSSWLDRVKRNENGFRR